MPSDVQPTAAEVAADPEEADGPAYAAAISELERILAELEGDDPDVDVLTARVRRAAELIRLCRGRINVAKAEVEQVVAELGGPASGDTPGGAPPASPCDLSGASRAPGSRPK